MLLPEIFVGRCWSNFERFLRRGQAASADDFLGCVIDSLQSYRLTSCLTSQCLSVVGLLHLQC